MATAKVISAVGNNDTEQIARALQLALSGDEGLGVDWASRLLSIPQFRDFVRDFFDADWCDDPQRQDEIGILLGAGTLFAAGMVYAQELAQIVKAGSR